MTCLLFATASGEVRLTDRRTVWFGTREVFVKKVCVRSKNDFERLQPFYQLLCSQMRVPEEHLRVFAPALAPPWKAGAAILLLAEDAETRRPGVSWHHILDPASQVRTTTRHRWSRCLLAA